MDKRERIIQAAVDIFYEKGFENTKISDITKAAGIAQGTFYLYFPSKFALLPSIAEKVVIKLLDTVKGKMDFDSDFSKELEQLINIVFKFINEYKIIYAFLYTGLSQSKYLKEWETIYSPFYEWMSNFIKERKEKKIIRSKLSAEQLAKLMITVIEATAEQVYLYDTVNLKYIESQKQDLHKFLLDGLGVKSK